MNIDITRLASLIDNEVIINEVYSFSDEELKESGILKLDNVNIVGNITRDSIGNYVLDIAVNGTMVLPCSVSLKSTDYKFNIVINDTIENLYDELGKKFKNSQKTIDIFPIIWENILMEIPMKIVNSNIDNIVTSGDGWELLKDEDE